MAYDFPKVLVSCPTAQIKDYCFNDWIENVMGFKYPRYDIFMYDNTPDKGKYAKSLNRRFKARYGYEKSRKFKAYNSLELSGKTAKLGVIERMALSHNHCRKATLQGGYDYLLHLESDVFPPQNVIERLLFHQKQVANALYYTDEGKYRRPVIQMHLDVCPDYGSVFWLTPTDEIGFLNGRLLKVALAGLGCSLIRRDVLAKIDFRNIKGIDLHPDTLFAEDCEANGIDKWVDTSIVCEHRNRQWGVFGIDYK